MTNRVNPLRQLAIGSVAVLTTALTFGATVTPAPAYAQSGAYYRATLQQPVEKRTEIIRGGTFICSGTVCVGTKARSRPELVCKKLAGELLGRGQGRGRGNPRQLQDRRSLIERSTCR